LADDRLSDRITHASIEPSVRWVNHGRRERLDHRLCVFHHMVGEVLESPGGGDFSPTWGTFG